MLSQNNSNDLPGLSILKIKDIDQDFNGILPLLAEEFPTWGLSRIKNYIKLLLKQETNGILVAKNISSYNTGLLIYSIHDIMNKNFSNDTNKKFSKCLVVENLINSNPVLEKQIYLQFINKIFYIAKNKNCEIVELPRFNSSFDLVKKKYKKKLININGWRFFIKIN